LAHADLYVWDVVNGKRVASYPDAGRVSNFVRWSPDSQQVIVGVKNGTYLWTVASDQKVRLTESPYFPYVVDWDEGRGQVFVAPTLYDRFSGTPLMTFDDGQTGGRGYIFSDDGNRLVAYTRSYTQRRSESSFQDFRFISLTVWNRDGSLVTAIQTPVDGVGFWPNIAFSPDDHYMAVGGRYEVRVWDLQSLNPDTSQPNYHFAGPVSGIHSIQFVGNTTVETTNHSGTAQDWDIFSGALVE